jgi:hypothetical protein
MNIGFSGTDRGSLSDVFGASGLLMLQALAEGKDTAQEMAQLAKKQLRKKIPELQLALEGKMESPPFLVKRATASTLGSGKRSRVR